MKGKLDFELLVERTCDKKNGVVRIGFGAQKKLYGIWNIDTKEMVCDFEFTDMSPEFIYGLAVVTTVDGKLGIIKEDGKFFIKPSGRYSSIMIHNSGVIILDTGTRKEIISAKTRQDITHLTFSEVEIIWEKEEMCVLKVRRGDNADVSDVGVVRSDGVWLAKPQYDSAHAIYDYVVVEDKRLVGTLINIRNGKHIVSGGGITPFVCGEKECFKYSEGEIGKKSLAVLDNHKVTRIISGFYGYVKFSESSCDLIQCVHEGMKRSDIFSLDSDKFVLKNARIHRSLITTTGRIYVFEADGGKGVIAENGEILLEGYSEIFPLDWKKFFKVEENGLFAIWDAEIREYVTPFEFYDIIGPDEMNCFLVSKFVDIGVHRRKVRQVWYYLNENGKELFSEVFLKAEFFNKSGCATVKAIDGKKKIITKDVD